MNALLLATARKDNRGRALRKGEVQRASDNRYMYTYRGIYSKKSDMNEYDAIRRGFKTFPHNEAPFRVKTCRKRLFFSVCGIFVSRKPPAHPSGGYDLQNP